MVRANAFGGPVGAFRSILQACLTGIGLILFCPGFTRAASRTEPQPNLTTIQQIRTLQAGGLERRESFRVQGTVLFYDPERKVMIVQDDTAASSFVAPKETLKLKPRQLVELAGTVGAGASPPTVRVLSATSLLQPRQATVEKVLGGGLDYSFVELSGTVRSCGDRDGFYLKIQTSGGFFWVGVRRFPKIDPQELMESQVRVRGPVTRGEGEMVPLIWVEDIAEIEIVQHRDPFDVRQVTITQLSKTPDFSQQSRIRVTGAVKEIHREGGLVIGDDAGGELELANYIGPQVFKGDQIEVSAYPNRKGGTIVLADALAHLTGWERRLAPPASKQTRTPTVAAEPLPTLTTIQQVRSLSFEEAEHGYPVRVKAAVTFVDRDWGMLFVQDETAGVYVEKANELELRIPGQWVEIRAVTGPGAFAPVLEKASFELLEEGKLPRARRTPLERALTGTEDSQWVEMSGIVRRVWNEGGHLKLLIVTPNGRFLDIIPHFEGKPIPKGLIDADATFRGACGSEYNQKRQLKAVNLLTPSIDFVHVDRPGPDNPFLLDLTPIGSIGQFQTDVPMGHRVHVRGTVTFQERGKFLYVQDESRGLYVETQQMDTVKAGDVVDVIGFPDMGKFSPSLGSADFRRVASELNPVALPVTPRQALSEYGQPDIYDRRLISITGQIRDVSKQPQGDTLLIESDSTLFYAKFAKPFSLVRKNLPIGLKVRLTGICQVEADESGETTDFSILLRSPEDITALQAPPWWTVQHTVAVLATLVLVGSASLGWIVILRRRVVRQTEVIRGQLERDHMVSELNKSLSAVSASTEAARIVLHAIGAKANWSRCSMAYCDPEKFRVQPIVTIEVMNGEALEAFPAARARPATHLEARVIREGAQIVDPCQPTDTSGLLPQKAYGKPLGWVGALPVRNGARTVGLLAVERDIAQPYSKEDLHDIQTLVDSCAAALERVRAEEASRASEERFKLASRATSDVVWDWDLATDYIQWSDSMHRLLGCLPEDIEPDFTFWFKRIHPDDEKPVLASLEAVIKSSQRFWSSEYRVRRNDDSYAYVLDRGYVVHDKDDKAVRMIGAMQDITARKQSEIDLRRAQSAAEQANCAKSEFLANMSHEIRTPMNGIIGMSNLLLETHLEPEQRDFAQTVRNSGEALLTIINDILDFSKIEAGKLRLEVLDFDLREVVEDTTELFGERARHKGVEMATFIPDEVPICLRGDPGRLRQVLLNLVGNAVKFTERGEILVSVSCDSNDATEARIRIEITDTGVGIAAEVQPRLFQAFTQADGSTTRRYGGTGLGLAISRQLIEMMGGQIGVQSNLGNGSQFWFTVQLARQPGVPAQQSPRLASLAGLRVLVVDDNAANRTIVHHHVISWRMRTDSVAGGAEALDVLRHAAAAGDAYALAVLDLQMPEMDGLMLAKAIKADPSIASVRLVLLTSLSQRLTEGEMRQHDIAACLFKPVRQSGLFNALVNALAAQPPPTQARLVAETVRPKLHTAAPGKGPRLLLAEDNVVNQKVALRLLQKLGYSADVATNGREALEALERNPYPLVFMDCHMPELDGFNATRRIRERENAPAACDRVKPRVRIIALTADAMQGDREKCLAAGMDDYITKPVRLEDLRLVLEKHLLGAGAEDGKTQGYVRQS